jgi:hypothetical protein
MIADSPEPLSDPIQHAMLGAVGEHLSRRWDLTIPPWTEERERFLKRPYFTTTMEGLKALLLVESPIAFRRRLIFTEAEPLRRARMPRRPGDGPGAISDVKPQRSSLEHDSIYDDAP